MSAAKGLAIRAARAEDYEGLRRLKNQVHGIHMAARPDYFLRIDEALPPALLLEWLGPPGTDAPTGSAAPKYGLFVAELGGRIAGYALMTDGSVAPGPVYRGLRRWLMEELCVDEADRGAGIGAALFSFVEEEGRRRGYEALELSVWDFNEDAAAFYRGRGMTRRFSRFEKRL